jgi:hypothetical protein
MRINNRPVLILVLQEVIHITRNQPQVIAAAQTCRLYRTALGQVPAEPLQVCPCRVGQLEHIHPVVRHLLRMLLLCHDGILKAGR